VQIVRRLFRQATWLAIVAMVGLALVPTVSHALAASGPGNPWAEICSVAGGKLVMADAAGAQADAGVHLGHCPLCGQLADSPALPMPPSGGLAVPDGADFLPMLFGQSPSPLFAWAAAQPRAPPASC
jgi:hypothetical protein